MNNSQHSYSNKMVFGDAVAVFECHVEQRACQVKVNGDFDYCPYCGQEVQ